MRTPRFFALSAIAAVSLTGLVGLGSVASAAVQADELAVSVVGDGVTTGNSAVPVSIALMDGLGRDTGTVALPIAATGSQHAFTLGADRDQQGALQQSADHRFITLGGYDAAPGSGSLNDTAAPSTLRVVARVAADDTVDTSTTLGGAYSLRHIRGTATIDGSRYWTDGHGGDSTAPAGSVLTIEAGGSTPTAVVAGSSNLNNGRVLDFHDGQLYATSDRSGFSGLNQVGTGAPTAAGTALTLVARAPSGATVPHDFAFAGDYLYVGYTEGDAEGIAKYAKSGSTWTWVATYPGDYWGIEGRAAGDDTVLYAVKGSGQGNQLVRIVDTGDDTAFTGQEDVLATADAGTAYRGVAFAPGFTPGSDAVPSLDAAPTVAWTPRVAGGTGSALAAVLGQKTNPAARGVISDPNGETVTATAVSNNAAVVSDDNITVTVGSDGAFELAAEPTTAGSATITVTATTADGRSGSSQLTYRVAKPFAAEDAVANFGMSDASAAIDAGDGYFFAADDDSNAIRLFSDEGGEPVAEFDFSDQIEFERAGEAHDFEAVAQEGNQVFWIGSTGNTRSGNVRLDRNIVLQTEVHGYGAESTLTFVGYRNALRDALVTWDHEDQHGLGADYFGFLAATQPGISAEGPHSLNVEGAAIAPDGTTLWVGFRSPEVGDSAEALIVPVANIANVVAGADPAVGEPILLDLDGRAIRDIARTDDGNYLIIAGSADDSGRFALYGWSGDPADTPVAASTPLGIEGWPGSYEGIAGVESLTDGTSVRLLLDSGTVDIYGDGTEAQDLSAVELKMFPAQTVSLGFGAAFTAKTVSVPGDALRVGTPTQVTATGFAPGESISFVLHSDPVELATVTAAADGTATATVTVPASVPVGAHTLTASAASGEGSLAVTVRAAAVPGDDTRDPDVSATPAVGDTAPAQGALATTGSEAPISALALAIMMIAVGAIAIRARVRRG